MRLLSQLLFSSFFLSLLPLGLFAQADWPVHTHALGVTFSHPPELEVKQDTSVWLVMEGYVRDVFNLKFRVGLESKSEFAGWGYRYHLRHGHAFQKVPASLNAQLAERPGLPAVLMEEVTWNGSGKKLTVRVQYDETRLLHIEFDQWPLKDEAAAEEICRKMVRSFRITKPAPYKEIPGEDRFFDPIPYDGSWLGEPEGPLARRLRHVKWDLPKPWCETDLRSLQISLCEMPDGGFAMAWQDSGFDAHIQRFTADFAPVGQPLSFPDTRIEALAVSDNTFGALLTTQPVGHRWNFKRIHLAIFDFDFNEQMRIKLLGEDDLETTNNKWLHVEWGQTRMEVVNGFYGIYLSKEMNHGPEKGVHQSDNLFFVSEEGEVGGLKPEQWIVSHSFSKAIAADGLTLHMVAVGDAHPRALAYSSSQPIRDMKFANVWRKGVWRIPGEEGNNDAKFNYVGGMVAQNDRKYIVFRSHIRSKQKNKKGDYLDKIGLLILNAKGEAQHFRYLNYAPERVECNMKIVPYGKQLLVLWSDYVPGMYQRSRTWRDRYMLLNENGQRVTGPHNLPTWFQFEMPRTERQFFGISEEFTGSLPLRMSDGSVLWARYLLKGDAVEFVKFAAPR